VNTGDLAYHAEHFLCGNCGMNLVGKRYRLDKSTKMLKCTYCVGLEQRTARPQAHICAHCHIPINGEYIVLQGQYMHPRHFRCEECGTELSAQNFREFEGDFYCTAHYEILLLKKCARCGKPIMGRSISALGKVWHPEHFTCHICQKPFAESMFRENDGIPYCESHYNEGFGDKCEFCREPILSGGIKFLEKAYHNNHFRCDACQKPLTSGNFSSWEKKPLCINCYSKLPKKVRELEEKRIKEEKKAKEEIQKLQ